MTFDEMQAAVHNYVHRTDAETVANEPTALEMARYKLGRDFFPEGAAVWLTSMVATDGVVQLPPDFGQADTVEVSGGGGDLDYSTPRQWVRMQGSKDTKGKFSIVGDKLYVDPGVASIDLLYYLKVEQISGSASNWASDGYPDVWIWLGVAEQHRFVQDFESAQLSEQYAMQLAGDAVMRTRANRGGGSLRMTSRRA